MTKRESSVEEGGSILQMLAVKGSRKEELHGNYKNTEKKKIVLLWEVDFFSCAMKWGLQRVARWGRRGVESWLWKKKNQSMIK